MPEVGEASEKRQQELMAKREDFELYAGWPELEKSLTSHLSFRSEQQPDSAGAQAPPEREAADVNILVPGCGRSKLSENLYDAGFKNITNLDISKDVICDMLKRNERVRPEMEWHVMDITMMQFADETFDAIVDEGGLDSLMAAMPNSSLGLPYLHEVKRVLKAGGKYVCLTLAERHVLELLFPMFRFRWRVSLYAISQEASSRHLKLQTFMVVAEKMSSLEVCSSAILSLVEESSSNQARDLNEILKRENGIRTEYICSGADVIYSLEDLRYGAIQNLSQLVPGRTIKLNLGRAGGVLFDAKEDSGHSTHHYDVLLVKRKQAHDWLHTSEGQLLVSSMKASRLLMILQDPSSSHLSMDDIQMDLTPFAKLLEPGDCGEGFEIPYQNGADKIEEREIVYEDSSVLTGQFVVENVIFNDTADVQADYKGRRFRRLIFKRSVNLVQSEALLSIKYENTFPVMKIIHNHLVSQYHRGIVFGIRLTSSYWEESTFVRGLVKTVVIGLGGGLLPIFLKNYLPFLKIEVVELDPKVLQVARDYFGFREYDDLKVHITDGLKFVKEKADGDSSCKVDILVVDVHSSDTSSILTSPATDFVDESFLLTVKESLSKQGIFIINLVSRSCDMRKAVHSRVKKVFSSILSLPIKVDISEVLFASDSPMEEDQLSQACKEFVKSIEHEKKWIEEEADLSKSIKLLN